MSPVVVSSLTSLMYDYAWASASSTRLSRCWSVLAAAFRAVVRDRLVDDTCLAWSAMLGPGGASHVLCP